MASRGDVLCSLCLVQRSSGSILLLQEEAQHLAAGVRPPRVGVGPGLTSTRPGVARPMKHPLLKDKTSALVSLDGAGVGGPSLRLPAAHGWAQIGPSLRLSNDLITIDWADRRIAIAVEHDRGHGTPRPVVRRARPRWPALPHGSECGGKILGDTTSQPRMDADRGIQVRVGGPITAPPGPPTGSPAA